MSRFSPSRLLLVWICVVELVELGSGQQRFQRPMRGPQQLQQQQRRRVPPPICAPDVLMFYQDCRMCVCPRPNRVSKCYRKSCDLRTKDTGQCPTSVLRVNDGKSCPTHLHSGCKVDADCPGPQLCCFDFCGGAKCTEPVPLDLLTGEPHRGRGYAYT